MRRTWTVVAVGIAAVVVGCGEDDIDENTFRSQADAVFCTDLVSARETIISGVIDADGQVALGGVVSFAAGYEPILRDHVSALQALRRPDDYDRHVAAVVDAATEIAERLHAVAADPSTATANTVDDLRVLATSPALIDRLTAAGLRTC